MVIIHFEVVALILILLQLFTLNSISYVLLFKFGDSFLVCAEYHIERNFEKAQKPLNSKIFEDPDESMEESEII